MPRLGSYAQDHLMGLKALVVRGDVLIRMMAHGVSFGQRMHLMLRSFLARVVPAPSAVM